MSDYPSTPFGSGAEYDFFTCNYCENCNKYKENEEGFPAFPEEGGCRILDAMEKARFDLSLFPNKKIREIRDENDKVVKWHHCIDYEEYETKPKRKPIKDKENIMKCENCDECVYVGEGDSLCMKTQEIVITDFGCPTEEYQGCKNKK